MPIRRNGDRWFSENGVEISPTEALHGIERERQDAEGSEQPRTNTTAPQGSQPGEPDEDERE